MLPGARATGNQKKRKKELKLVYPRSIDKYSRIETSEHIFDLIFCKFFHYPTDESNNDTADQSRYKAFNIKSFDK